MPWLTGVTWLSVAIHFRVFRVLNRKCGLI